MHILVILAHPDPFSFNHAIATQACETLKLNGHTITFHDLYREGFDPMLPADEILRDAELTKDISKHCREVASVDGLIIVHPNWWGMPPAILTGWVDRVFRPGVAYAFVENDKGEGVPMGLLKADKAIVFNTSNTIKEREENVFGDPLERIWKDCIFNLCGIKESFRHIFRVVVTSTLEERRIWLTDVDRMVNEYFPTNS